MYFDQMELSIYEHTCVFLLALDDDVRFICADNPISMYLHIHGYCNFLVSVTVPGWCSYLLLVVLML